MRLCREFHGLSLKKILSEVSKLQMERDIEETYKCPFILAHWLPNCTLWISPKSHILIMSRLKS